MSKIFKIKTGRISKQIISAYPNMPWKIKFQIGLTPFLTVKYERQNCVNSRRYNYVWFEGK